MKLWKVILGIVAFIGGIFAVSTSKKADKKEFDKKIKENKAETKKVQEATKKVEAEKKETKKQITEAKKKTATTKKQVKSTTSAKKTAENFEKKYRKKPGRPKKNA